ncbi:MAG: hypothetical protein ACLQOO_05385 [Terriglobia bacterium]
MTRRLTGWAQRPKRPAGAVALFRTSLFTAHAGDRDIGAGPSAFLQVFRDAAGRLMDGNSYEKAIQGLPPCCIALMQDVLGTRLRLR